MIFVSDKADKNLYLNLNCSGHRWGGHAPARHPDYPVSNPRLMRSTFTTLSGRCQSCSVRSKQYARDRSNRCETDTQKRPDNRRAGVLIWNGPEVQGRLAYQLHPLPASPRIIRLPDIRAVSDCLSVELPQTLCPRLRPLPFRRSILSSWCLLFYWRMIEAPLFSRLLTFLPHYASLKPFYAPP